MELHKSKCYDTIINSLAHFVLKFWIIGKSHRLIAATHNSYKFMYMSSKYNNVMLF